MANTGINRFAKADVAINIGRSRLDRSFGHTTTFKSGDLVPIFCDDVLPGDTIRIDYSMVTRMLTPVAPVFGNAFFDIWFFFIPNRLVADYGSNKKVWEQLQGENISGYWANTSEMVLETVDFLSCEAMSVANYLGLPVLSSDLSIPVKINNLALKSYTLCWNEFFRDQNIEAPKDINLYGIKTTGAPGEYFSRINRFSSFSYGSSSGTLKVAKLHDYFTSCLPAPQKGDPVRLGAGFAPVYAQDGLGNEEGIELFVNGTSTGAGSGTIGLSSDALVNGSGSELNFANVYADLSDAIAPTINNLRQAFAIQRLLETDARGGTRYREMLKAHFGVTIPDYTAQVPEYLGGKRTPINITQVLQTSNNTGASTAINSNHIGQVGAFSNTSDKGFVVDKSFHEYGILLGVCAVRTEQQYSQGIPKMFSKFRRYDYYMPEFALLGEQPVLNKEIYVGSNATTNEEVFGYQESWAEYRYHPNYVTGNFSAGSGDATLGAWTYGNEFNGYPALNSSFIHQSSSNIGDTLYDTNTTTQFIADFWFNCDYTRAMPVSGVPGGLTGRW